MQLVGKPLGRTIGITGCNGFLATHVQALCHALGYECVIGADRAVFQNELKLKQFVQQADVILHLAGVNRHETLDLESENVLLADKLVQSLRSEKRAVPIAYSSSIHIKRDTPYGRGKAKAGEILRAYCAGEGIAFGNFIFPHLFGEFGKPFYNSVVATFAHQIAVGDFPQVVNDIDLELLHAQEAAGVLVEFCKNTQGSDLTMSGKPIKVSDLLTRMTEMDRLYRCNQFPDLQDRFSCDLFNTYRSKLFPSFYPVKLTLHSDNRGSLFEAVKGGGGNGQTFVSSTKERIVRGNHFHLRKVERFLVLSGKAEISLRRLFSDDTVTFAVTGDEPSFVDIPTFYTHNIRNVGAGELLTLFWSNEIFNPAKSDTYQEAV